MTSAPGVPLSVPDEHPDRPPSARVLAARGRLLARIDQLGQHSPVTAPEDDPSSRYAIGEVIACGGLGRIRRVYDRRLRRDVALKEPRSSSSEAARRLLLEASITARLEHPGIIPIYDVGQLPDGAPFFCMKLVEPGSLAEAIREGVRLQERLHLLERVLVVADAIAYAHRQGVIHRDLKPANILLGTHGETVIIDWGLAKLLDGNAREGEQTLPSGDLDDSERTERGTVIGTLHYMAPEQARGEAIDARADVFSLGAVLFNVLGGRPPYPELTREALVARVRQGDVERLLDIEPEVPRDLAAIVTRAMAPRREDRYPDAEGFAADLRRFLTGHVVDAHDYRVGERMRLWLRRNRAVAQVGGVALALLLAAGITFVRGLRSEADRARRAEVTAQTAKRLAERRADAAILARARTLLDDDPGEALKLLREVSLTDEEQVRRVRQLAIAAQSRDRPAQVLRGHTSAIQSVAALSDGGLVSVDATGAVWEWDVTAGTGEQILDLGAPKGIVAAAAEADIWGAFSDQLGYVIRDDGAPEALDIGLARGAGGRIQASFAQDGSALLLRSPRGGVHASPGVQVWDLHGLSPVRRLSRAGQTGAALSPDGQTLVLGDRRRGAEFIAPGQHRALPWLAHPLGFSRDGGRLVIAGRGRGRRETAVLSVDSGEIIGELVNDAAIATVGEEFVLIHGIDEGRLPIVSDYRLALRSLTTGRDRWSITLHELANRDVFHAFWGGEQRFASDEEHRRFAFAVGGQWRIHSLEDGSLLHTIRSPAPVGTFTTDDAVVLGDGDELQVWRPAVPETIDPLLAIAAGGSVTVTQRHREPPVLRRGDESPRTVGCPGSQRLTPQTIAVNELGDAIIKTYEGHACIIGPANEARRLDVDAGISAIAVARDAHAFSFGTIDGEVVHVTPGDALPRHAHLPGEVLELWVATGGASTYALIRSGALYLLRDGQPPLLLLAAGDGGDAPAGAALHPGRNTAAFVFPSRSLLLLHDANAGTPKRLDLELSEVPVSVYSPSGEQLAVAVANRGLALFDSEGVDPPQTIALPAFATGIAFEDETVIIASTAEGALLRVDLAIEDVVVLREPWVKAEPFSVRLEIREDGAVLALSARRYAYLKPHGVPAEADTLAAWLARTGNSE